ncbi:MAG: LysM peptidoglycan-binding domain-containing protein [Parachlamydiales bacterium]|nr:LysM peptidoglycan-binding domain-containing protein [Parachlamydiales bacterium]
MRTLLLFSPFVIFLACSPIKSSEQEGEHQLELTLHEVQTNIDDFRHDLHCYQAEQKILEGKLQHQEALLQKLQTKEGDDKTKTHLLLRDLHQMGNNFKAENEKNQDFFEKIEKLLSHSQETDIALTQYKQKITELEKMILSQNRRFEEISSLKQTLQSLATALDVSLSENIYIVKPGDSLDRIAKNHRTSVAKLKEINDLKHDLIVVGQKLKLP